MTAHPVSHAPCAPSQDRQARIAKLAYLLEWGCAGLAALLPAALAAFWLLTASEDLAGYAKLPVGSGGYGIGLRLLGFGITLLPVGLLAIGLWQLRALCRLYRQGRVFTLAATETLRRAVGWLLAAQLVKLAIAPILSVAMSWQFGPGQRQLAISLSSNDLLGLLIVGLLYLVAAIMAEATRLAEDHAAIV